MSPQDPSSDHLFSIIFKCITYDVISLHHIPFRLQASITFSPYYVMKSQKKQEEILTKMCTKLLSQIIAQSKHRLRYMQQPTNAPLRFMHATTCLISKLQKTRRRKHKSSVPSHQILILPFHAFH